jgi:hypothetical protein
MPQLRTIHRLQLRCERESDARSLAIRFEDALRTATLPDTGGRLVFLRRLDLGKIRGDSTSTALSLLIAEAFEREKSSCVHATDIGAGNAPAVWFRDALEAHTSLAQCVLAGTRTDAWFWRKAVPSVSLDGPVTEILRAIVLSLAATPEAPTAVPHWAAALVRAGHARAIVEMFDSKTSTALERAIGLPPPIEPAVSSIDNEAGVRSAPQGARSHAISVSHPQHRRDATDVLERWFSKIGDSVAASVLRRSIGGSLEHDIPFGEHDTPQRSSLRSASDIPLEADSATSIETVASISGSRLEPANSHLRVARDQRSNAANDALAAVRDSLQSTTDAESPLLFEERRTSHGDRAWGLRGAETLVGGIGFLFGVLIRLGYVEWLEAQPQWSDRPILPLFFARVLTSVGAPDHDPAWALTTCRETTEPAPADFIAPQRWRDGLSARRTAALRHGTHELGAWTDASGRLLLAAWWQSQSMPDAVVGATHRRSSISLKDPDRVVADAWFIATRRWLRRYGKIGLHDLVHRPARLEITATHLDVWFDPAHADLRVRKAGLDIDPGWLPWWGRAVAFHYERLPYANDDGVRP